MRNGQRLAGLIALCAALSFAGLLLLSAAPGPPIVAPPAQPTAPLAARPTGMPVPTALPVPTPVLLGTGPCAATPDEATRQQSLQDPAFRRYQLAVQFARPWARGVVVLYTLTPPDGARVSDPSLWFVFTVQESCGWRTSTERHGFQLAGESADPMSYNTVRGLYPVVYGRHVDPSITYIAVEYANGAVNWEPLADGYFVSVLAEQTTICQISFYAGIEVVYRSNEWCEGDG